MYVILLLNLCDCCLKGQERGGIKAHERVRLDPPFPTMPAIHD